MKHIIKMGEKKERKVNLRDYITLICGVLIARGLTKISLSEYDFDSPLNLICNSLANSKVGFLVLYVSLGLYQKEIKRE